MRIVADENIVALDAYFSDFGELIKLPGRQISAQSVRDADALLVRSITPVNAALLSGSRVQFVATATSGTDHLDLPWLAGQGIMVADAAGCNANAVVEYVFAALCELFLRKGFNWQEKSFAVIGAGHVGGRLLRLLQSLDVACVACDPFVESTNPVAHSWCTLEQALQADIISVHVPLTYDGAHPTFHLLNAARLAKIKPGTLLINTARGEVVDNQALLAYLQAGADLLTVLDVWEGEPNVNVELLQLVDIATPHIAGYSVQAKLAASLSNYESFVQHFGLQSATPVVTANQSALLPPSTNLLSRQTALEVLKLFALEKSSEQFKSRAGQHDGAALFDAMRRELSARKEFGLSQWC